jgi:hypothetical protein
MCNNTFIIIIYYNYTFQNYAMKSEKKKFKINNTFASICLKKKGKDDDMLEEYSG